MNLPDAIDLLYGPDRDRILAGLKQAWRLTCAVAATHDDALPHPNPNRDAVVGVSAALAILTSPTFEGRPVGIREATPEERRERGATHVLYLRSAETLATEVKP